MSSQIDIELRVKEVANDIYNGVSRDEILQKIAKNYGIAERQGNVYYQKAQDFIRAKLQGSSTIERSIELLQAAVPQAIETLMEAMTIKDETNKPNQLAVRAAGEVLKKGMPDELRIIKPDEKAIEKLKAVFGDEELITSANITKDIQ